MAFCMTCGTETTNDMAFCPNCGAPVGAAYSASSPGERPSPKKFTVTDLFRSPDHTAEFFPEDISENKVFAITSYLFGLFGITLSVLLAKKSPYAYFHARQALKIIVSWFFLLFTYLASMLACEMIFRLINLMVNDFTTLVTIKGIVLIIFTAPFGICSLFLALILPIICMISACKGKAKDPLVVGALPFLK